MLSVAARHARVAVAASRIPLRSHVAAASLSGRGLAGSSGARSFASKPLAAASRSALSWSPQRLSSACVPSLLRCARSLSSASKPPHSVSDPPLPTAHTAGTVAPPADNTSLATTNPDAKAAAVLSPVESWAVKRSRLWGKVKAEAKHYCQQTPHAKHNWRESCRMATDTTRDHQWPVNAAPNKRTHNGRRMQ